MSTIQANFTEGELEGLKACTDSVYAMLRNHEGYATVKSAYEELNGWLASYKEALARSRPHHNGSSSTGMVSVPDSTFILGRYFDLQQGIPALRLAIREQTEVLTRARDGQGVAEQLRCLNCLETWLKDTEEKQISTLRSTWPALVEAYNKTFFDGERQREIGLVRLARLIEIITNCKDALNSRVPIPGSSVISIPNGQHPEVTKLSVTNDRILPGSSGVSITKGQHHEVTKLSVTNERILASALYLTKGNQMAQDFPLITGTDIPSDSAFDWFLETSGLQGTSEDPYAWLDDLI